MSDAVKRAAEALRMKALLEDLEDWLCEHAPRDGLGLIITNENKRRTVLISKIRIALGVDP